MQTNVELERLKTAVTYLANVLEEGSLVERYDKATREEMAVALRLLLVKVDGLPEETPAHLVQATAVRALVGASEKMAEAERQAKEDSRARYMREAVMSANLRGCDLGEWTAVSESDMEYMATCQRCGGVVYVNHRNIYSLLPETCRPELDETPV